jgi:hypothetical protein
MEAVPIEKFETLAASLGLLKDDIRKLGLAAEACRLSMAEFVRLTLVKDLHGREETPCPQRL